MLVECLDLCCQSCLPGKQHVWIISYCSCARCMLNFLIGPKLNQVCCKLVQLLHCCASAPLLIHVGNGGALQSFIQIDQVLTRIVGEWVEKGPAWLLHLLSSNTQQQTLPNDSKDKMGRLSSWCCAQVGKWITISVPWFQQTTPAQFASLLDLKRRTKRGRAFSFPCTFCPCLACQQTHI